MVFRKNLKYEKHFDSLSSKLNENEKKVRKLNVRNFDK